MKSASGEAGLVRALGTWGLAASIVNITIGGGIFRAPGSQEVTGRLGAAAPLAYVVCALAMAFVVLCFAEAGRRVALTGGPYAYVERAFGRFAGFLVGWQLWLVGTIATAAVATIFADSALRMFPSLPPGPGRALLLVAMFATVVVINVLGVQFGARLNMASTIAKLLPLALLIVFGLANAKSSNFSGATMPAVSDLGRASIVVLFVFAGLESALVPSGEVRDPARTVPRAVFIGLAIVTVVYILIQVAAQGVLGDSLAGRTAPLADLGEAVMGPFGAGMIGIAVVLSTFGYLCGMILAIPRALFAFARDGFLPSAIATVHPRFHTPWLAIIVQAVLSLVLALTSVWEQLVIFANVAVLFVYLGCAAAAWQLRRAGISDEVTAPPRIPGSAFGPPLATLVIIALLTSVTAREWIWIGGAAVVGLLLYWFSQLRTRRDPPARSTAENVPAPQAPPRT